MGGNLTSFVYNSTQDADKRIVDDFLNKLLTIHDKEIHTLIVLVYLVYKKGLKAMFIQGDDLTKLSRDQLGKSKEQLDNILSLADRLELKYAKFADNNTTEYVITRPEFLKEYIELRKNTQRTDLKSLHQRFMFNIPAEINSYNDFHEDTSDVSVSIFGHVRDHTKISFYVRLSFKCVYKGSLYQYNVLSPILNRIIADIKNALPDDTTIVHAITNTDRKARRMMAIKDKELYYFENNYYEFLKDITINGVTDMELKSLFKKVYDNIKLNASNMKEHKNSSDIGKWFTDDEKNKILAYYEKLMKSTS